ncbi:MAG: hypothetical protein FWF69_04045 [Firmicutes bacterium]|nr:hypothetical protein [Bacillota bacterium]
MQRKSGAAGQRQYVKSGLPGRSAPGGQKKNPARQILKRIILAAVVLVGVILVVYLFTSLLDNAGRPVPVGARPTDNIQPFGENLLYYDGVTLTCVGPNGASKWQFFLGPEWDYCCTKTMIAAWAGNQLQVIDKNGVSTYNDRMEGQVRMARVGEAYVAACIAADASSITNSTIRVMSHTGAVLESKRVDDLYVLDFGFFYTRGQLVWVLSLDIDGNVPITDLSTLEPGRMATGAADLDDTMVYRVYSHDNLLMAVDTSAVQAFNYRCVPQTVPAPVPIYGWYMNDVRAAGRNTYALLEPMPGAGISSTFSELRLITNYTMQLLRLLAPCFASGLSEKGVYAFGENVICFAPYGSGQFKLNFVTSKLSSLICMLDNGRAVLEIGNGVYIMKLPT